MPTHKDDVSCLALRLNYGVSQFIDIVNSASHYYRPFHVITIKDNGKTKTRHIDNPHKDLPLRNLQKAIKKELLAIETDLLDPALVGGIKKRNMLSHINPHIGKPTIVCLDLSNCFPNISADRIFGVWKNQLGYSTELSKMLTKATTYRGYLPQGAPTSSILCNFALNPMAKKIHKMADANEIAYTQYIDDICLSGDDIVTRRMIGEIHKITYSFGQKINKSKTEIIDSKHKQRLMNLVANSRVKVNSEYIKKVRDRIINETSPGYICNGMMLSLLGQVLFVSNVDPKEGRVLENLLDRRVIGIYDGDLAKNKLNIKPCWQYKTDKTGRLKCSYLK